MEHLFIILYFAALLLIGFAAKRKTKNTSEDFFLAGRKFGSAMLLCTLAATNFSAFTFLGFAGASYKFGLGQYGIMGIGTALMPIMFYFLGRRIWALGKERGYATAPELVGGEIGDRRLQILFLVVMVAFTLPYLAVQAIGAGMLIEGVAGIGMKTGASVTLAVIGLYVLLGGMRGSAWTDAFQGAIMLLAMLLAVFFVSGGLGGFEKASLLAFDSNPELFERPGGGGYFTPEIWFSFMLLWMFVDPMFPQLFSRFYTARSEKSLRDSMIAYPVIVAILFFIPVVIGVWAHGAGLDVQGKTDMVLPLMVKTYAPQWVFSVVIVGAVAALMSTADSQLLSLSTMLARDLRLGNEVASSKALTVLLTFAAVAYVWFGFDPNRGIFGTLVSTTFSGLAVLFPSTVAALYFKKVGGRACILSIVAGEASIALFRMNLLPTFGFLDGILALAVASIVLFFSRQDFRAASIALPNSSASSGP